MEEKCTVFSTSASIKVAWDNQYIEKTAAPNTIYSYVIKYRVMGIKPFTSVSIRKDNNKLEMKYLKPETEYEINLYLCNEDEETSTLCKKKCRTGVSKHKILTETATADNTQVPAIYHLKPVSMIEHQLQAKIEHGTEKYVDCIRILDMIAEHKTGIHSSEEKSILLLGGTGTGKSTLIYALMNYIAEVSYTDDYRFGLICKTQEEKKREDRQCQSQTSTVTVYRIPRMKGLKVSCGINIIDTPGFNDTRKDFDKRIFAQIKELFERGITHLDAILIVLPLSTTRRTPGQTHILSSILDMFGDDTCITDNIFATLTHDDSGDEKNINMEFWKTRTENFSILFKTLEKTGKITITSSINVMRARCMLEIQLKSLEDVLSQQAQHIANYKEDKIVIKAIENESPDNRKISKYRRTVPETIEEGTFRESLNCPKCRKTCHKRCWVPVKKLNFTCEAMIDGKCTVCIRKCYVKHHELSRKIYQIKYVTKFYSGEEVTARHEKREETFKLLKHTIHSIENCITEINKTAITKDALSATEYIKHLADKELKKKREKGMR